MAKEEVKTILGENEEQHTYYVKEEYKTVISNEGGNTATIDVQRGNN